MNFWVLKLQTMKYVILFASFLQKSVSGHKVVLRMHTDWFQEFFSNNSLFWRYSLELSNLRFVWPYISLKNPRNYKKDHGKFSEGIYIENTQFHFNKMTEISIFFGPDYFSHRMTLNFCFKYLCNWKAIYAKSKILA